MIALRQQHRTFGRGATRAPAPGESARSSRSSAGSTAKIRFSSSPTWRATMQPVSLDLSAYAGSCRSRCRAAPSCRPSRGAVLPDAGTVRVLLARAETPSRRRRSPCGRSEPGRARRARAVAAARWARTGRARSRSAHAPTPRAATYLRVVPAPAVVVSGQRVAKRHRGRRAIRRLGRRARRRRAAISDRSSTVDVRERRLPIATSCRSRSRRATPAAEIVARSPGCRRRARRRRAPGRHARRARRRHRPRSVFHGRSSTGAHDRPAARAAARRRRTAVVRRHSSAARDRQRILRRRMPAVDRRELRPIRLGERVLAESAPPRRSPESHPEVELDRFLSEDMQFPRVPRLADSSSTRPAPTLLSATAPRERVREHGRASCSSVRAASDGRAGGRRLASSSATSRRAHRRGAPATPCCPRPDRSVDRAVLSARATHRSAIVSANRPQRSARRHRRVAPRCSASRRGASTAFGTATLDEAERDTDSPPSVLTSGRSGAGAALHRSRRPPRIGRRSADALIDSRDALIERLRRARRSGAAGLQLTRIHGAYHLGAGLLAQRGRLSCIIDFEGDPRPCRSTSAAGSRVRSRRRWHDPIVPLCGRSRLMTHSVSAVPRVAPVESRSGRWAALAATRAGNSTSFLRRMPAAPACRCAACTLPRDTSPARADARPASEVVGTDQHDVGTGYGLAPDSRSSAAGAVAQPATATARTRSRSAITPAARIDGRTG